MNALNLKTLTAAIVLAAALVPSAQAARRGGWDANGLSVSGAAVKAGAAVQSQGAQLRSVELPAATAASVQ